MTQTLEFSAVQQEAIDAVRDWFQHRSTEQQVFRLFGYAGTGKTTLAQYMFSSRNTSSPSL